MLGVPSASLRAVLAKARTPETSFNPVTQKLSEVFSLREAQSEQRLLLRGLLSPKIAALLEGGCKGGTFWVFRLGAPSSPRLRLTA